MKITLPILLSLFMASLVLPASVTGNAQDDSPIIIGAIFALTGKAKNSNQPAVLGAQLAVDQINRRGGVLGRRLELLLVDNESTPIGSHVAAGQVSRSGAVAIIGASWSSHSLAIARVAQEQKIPMISPVSTIPSLTAIGNYIFRVCYTDTLQGEVLARFAAEELQARSAMVFIDISSDFSINIAQIFGNHFKALGGTVTREIEYKTGQSDFSQQISQASAGDTDIAFLAGYDESGTIAIKLQEAEVRAIPLGSDGWDAESFFALGGNKIHQGFFTSHWCSTHDDPVSQAFSLKFKDLDIKSPTPLAYDAVGVLAAAIGHAGVAERQAIRDSLAGMQGFQGVTGNIVFDAQGDARKNACIMEIREGVTSHKKCYVPQPQ